MKFIFYDLEKKLNNVYVSLEEYNSQVYLGN